MCISAFFEDIRVKGSLYAISDLHIGFRRNRTALLEMRPHEADWLMIAGDLGENVELFEFGIQILSRRFKQFIWAPGNHDLWSTSKEEESLRGDLKYRRLVSICRKHHVFTPEDPYAVFESAEQTYAIAPVFIHYDYSYKPDHVSINHVIDWALENRVLSNDELYLHSTPYPSFQAWCHARISVTERRLGEASRNHPLIIVNHYPLSLLPQQYSRLSIWCGTRATETWHKRFNIAIAVSGHLHHRGTVWRDGVRFEEVSLGYPRQWKTEAGLEGYLRKILPFDHSPGSTMN
jgi:predicted phosphodiesterase